jgi:hypothetical protein
MSHGSSQLICNHMFQLLQCTCFLHGAVRNGFEACNIHYEGHWKGWALEIETFLGPEMATSEASAIWAQKSR